MRIAYVHFIRPDDTATNHVRQFVHAARGLGHDVTVHAMNGSVEGGGSGETATRSRPFARYLHEPKELAENLPYFAKQLRAFRGTRPDILLVRDYFLNASCVPLARFLGVPLVLEVNAPVAEMTLFHHAYWHVPRVPEALEGWKLRHADAVVVVSSALRDHLARLHALDASRFTVVPNGADTERFASGTVPDAEVRTWAGSDPVVGFIGSFQKWHASGVLAEVMRAVSDARPRVRFLLVGDGPESGNVAATVERLRDHVLWLGRVQHARIPALVAAMDVAVAPDCAFYMSPLKVVEWMAAGKAIVAPDRGGVRDLARDGVDAHLVPPADAVALVAATIRFVDDPVLRATMGAAAAERARTSLSWTENARLVLAACDRVRRGAPAGARADLAPSCDG